MQSSMRYILVLGMTSDGGHMPFRNSLDGNLDVEPLLCTYYWPIAWQQLKVGTFCNGCGRMGRTAGQRECFLVRIVNVYNQYYGF
ncbi:hypothetical protein HanRHA438_Chr03g0142281 [Helianthus annuus]|nr:hypothetical protein HanIR_Chr03g0142301 [Helianthus annuus]KAJ0937449.1 hypothetical protein HanRHA438_Chr03g0142281 [Helianthus annuus]